MKLHQFGFNNSKKNDFSNTYDLIIDLMAALRSLSTNQSTRYPAMRGASV